MALGEYISAGSDITKLLYHLNGNANDSSGNAYNGTATNVTFNNDYGVFSQGAYFNGSSSVITNGSVILSTSTFSTSHWVKPNAIPTVDYQKMVMISKWSSSNGGWSVELNYNGGTQAVTFLRYDNYNPQVYVNAIITLNTSKWYNIITAFSNPIARIYINGILYIENSTSRVAGSGSGMPLTIGCQDTIGSPAKYFGGYIDEIILENRYWTEKDVQKYYTMTKGRFGL